MENQNSEQRAKRPRIKRTHYVPAANRNYFAQPQQQEQRQLPVDNTLAIHKNLWK
jgi:hypothetical protein